MIPPFQVTGRIRTCDLFLSAQSEEIGYLSDKRPLSQDHFFVLMEIIGKFRML